MNTEKKPIFATIFMLIGVMILLKLGFWQVERLTWKDKLVTSIEQEYAKDLSQSLITAENFMDIHDNIEDGLRFRGKVSGQLDFTEKGGFVMPAAPKGGEPGYSLFVPFLVDGDKDVLLNIGWVHYQNKQIALDKVKLLPLQINSLVVEMVKTNMPPYVLVAGKDDHFLDIAEGLSKKPVLRNKHKSYAIFWFSMAVVLIIIYAARFGPSWIGR